MALSQGVRRNAPELWAQQEIRATGKQPAPSLQTPAGTYTRRTSRVAGTGLRAISDRELCGGPKPLLHLKLCLLVFKSSPVLGLFV